MFSYVTRSQSAFGFGIQVCVRRGIACGMSDGVTDAVIVSSLARALAVGINRAVGDRVTNAVIVSTCLVRGIAVGSHRVVGDLVTGAVIVGSSAVRVISIAVGRRNDHRFVTELPNFTGDPKASSAR